MSYQVIARKWRPQTFEEVTGQEHITQTLRNALEHDRLYHAYLFSGARGVGKTTTARLLAKALNCHKTDKPNLNPCASDDPNACPSCIEIAESRSMDVIEFDAASNTQVEKIRDIVLENIQIAPARDRFKIFIIDEVHQLSNHSFNALLKTLEEPPSNVVFVMATTELHKVPETIRSRCQEFDFRTIPLQKIFDCLKTIAIAEKIVVDDGALREIARSGMGSMRDAQSNFDQVISFSGESISVVEVTNALGMASTEMLTRVLEAISARSPKTALDVVAELVARGQDMRNFCRDLLAVFRDLMVFKVSGGEASLVESSVLHSDTMLDFSARFTESDFLRFFNSLSETESKLKEVVQPRYALEIGLVKLIEMRRVAPIEQILERLGRLESTLATGTLEPAPENAAAATAEKKTLISEPAAPDTDAPWDPQIEPADHLVSEVELPNDSVPLNRSTPIIDLGFIDQLPVKLLPISAEALEHVEDTWLDAAYDRKLEQSGDDLQPITNAAAVVEALVGKRLMETASHPSSGANGSATAAAMSPAYEPPDLTEAEGPVEPITLSANPSDEELLAFAQHHPLARKVMRIFRAKIVEVKRSPTK